MLMEEKEEKGFQLTEKQKQREWHEEAQATGSCWQAWMKDTCKLTGG